ncbi:hypothetical protein Clacol_007040 [Clathrus columnatus]|uniref:Peptidase A1 domain-containing protein n=1 Tax=Clathrus columnatus TaxID=1419009 RepID=A0AAV5AEX9_9AGAM|nr:hypothetical protein Clacol_007040 [Clathrus columnatus]
MTPTRSIIVPHSDLGITYIGNWSITATGSPLNPDYFGPSLFQTVSQITTNGSFSFLFNGQKNEGLNTLLGSSFEVVGTNSRRDEEITLNLTYQCILDGVGLENGTCAGTVAKGLHELTIEIASDGLPFYLDYILYTPLDDIQLNNMIINVSNSDPSLTFSSEGWATSDKDKAHLSRTIESSMNMTFFGKIVLDDMTLREQTTMPHQVWQGQWAVDKSLPTPFTINGTAKALPPHGQLFFEVGNLNSSLHLLDVTYPANETSATFGLNYIIIYPITPTTPIIATEKTTPSFPNITSISPSATATTTIKIPKSVIAKDVVLGLVVGIATGIILIRLCLWYQKRKSKRIQDLIEQQIMENNTFPAYFPRRPPVRARSYNRFLPPSATENRSVRKSQKSKRQTQKLPVSREINAVH